MIDEEDMDEKWVDLPCYEFNARLDKAQNDGSCLHCAKYLTTDCPHIDEFIVEEGVVDEF